MKTVSKKMKRLGIVLCTAAVIVCAGGCQRAQQQEKKQEQNQNQETSQNSKAPDFTADLTDGSSFTLSEQEGKVVLLNFWATWCSPCVEEMPALEKIHKEYGDQVKVVAVDCGEDKAVVDGFLKENGYTFSVGYDEKNEISRKYPVTGIPYTLVIGKDGVVQKTFTGSLGAEKQYEAYKEALEEIIAQ